MPPVPKRKHTRSRSNQRRAANSKVALPTLVKCSSCGKLKFPHKVCSACGAYS